MMTEFDRLNMVQTEGNMGVWKRRLQTFTIEHARTVNRFIVRDEWRNGRLVGSGFATVADAERAFATEDMRRVAW